MAQHAACCQLACEEAAPTFLEVRRRWAALVIFYTSVGQCQTARGRFQEGANDASRFVV
jgi:hypothetical protein